MIWGIGSALHEETEIDANAARYVNTNLADYLVPVNADVGTVEVIMVPEEDSAVNPLGIKGIGEIGIVGTSAAVANAVYHATGQRLRDLPLSPARIKAAIEKVVAAGAVPIVLGGDDSVPIPAIAGLAALGDLTILQIDAHVDWADVLQGNPYGYGSTMRRVAELPFVSRMVQVGIRGLGSGEAWQHDDARAFGSKLVTSYALHEQGPSAVLDAIAPGANVFVSIDCDGIDPAVLPAVNMPTPGGLTYEDMIRLLRGVAAKARIAGLAMVEYVPSRDDRYLLSGLAAARITAVALGLARIAMDD